MSFYKNTTQSNTLQRAFGSLLNVLPSSLRVDALDGSDAYFVKFPYIIFYGKSLGKHVQSAQSVHPGLIVIVLTPHSKTAPGAVAPLLGGIVEPTLTELRSEGLLG
jgi:hypothetical protein